MSTTDEIMELASDYRRAEALRDIQTARAALLKAVEEMAADAARYRLLKQEWCYDGWYPNYYNGRGKGRHEWTLWSEEENLDSALEAMRKATP